MENYDNAKKVLNKARKILPTDVSIWIHAAVLSETVGEENQVKKIIEAAMKSLKKNGANLSREEWMGEAQAAERQGSIMTSKYIIEFLDLSSDET